MRRGGPACGAHRPRLPPRPDGASAPSRQLPRYTHCAAPLARSRAAAIASRCGASAQAGSVFAASPVSRYAWQRQPPKSRVRSGHERHGSRIHASPRIRVHAGRVVPALSRASAHAAFQNSSPGQIARGVTGQHEPVGRDDDEAAAPAAHARLRASREVVGQDPLQLRSLRARALCRRRPATPLRAARATAAARRDCAARSRRTARWRARGDRRRASRASAISAPTFARLWRCSTTFSVSASPSARAARATSSLRSKLAVPAIASDAAARRVLDRELHAAQAGVAQRRESRRAERNAGRDEVRVEIARPRRGARSPRDRVAPTARRR